MCMHSMDPDSPQNVYYVHERLLGFKHTFKTLKIITNFFDFFCNFRLYISISLNFPWLVPSFHHVDFAFMFIVFFKIENPMNWIVRFKMNFLLGFLSQNNWRKNLSIFFKSSRVTRSWSRSALIQRLHKT